MVCSKLKHAITIRTNVMKFIRFICLYFCASLLKHPLILYSRIELAKSKKEERRKENTKSLVIDKNCTANHANGFSKKINNAIEYTIYE